MTCEISSTTRLPTLSMRSLIRSGDRKVLWIISTSASVMVPLRDRSRFTVSLSEG
jgi:hypothetical protein